MSASCKDGIEVATLVDYLAGELGPEAETTFEEHLFTCADCTERLRALERLGTAIADLAGHGRIFVSVTAEHVERAVRAGLRVRTYRLRPNETMPCTITPDDDANVVRLSADFAGTDRIDLDVHVVEGDTEQPWAHYDDIAVDRTAGDVVLLHPGAWIRPLGRQTFRLTLSDVEAGRCLGTYTLEHQPWEA